MIRELLPHLRRHWRRALAALACIVAISLLEFVIPKLSQYTIDHVIPGRRYDLLGWIALAVFGAAVLLGVFHYLSNLTISTVGQQVVYELRNRLYRHLHRLDMGFFDRSRTGDLMSRVTSDVGMLQQLVSSGMLSIVADLFTFAAIVSYMLYANAPLTLLVLATFPFLFAATRFFGRRIRRASRKVQESVADVSNHLQDTLSGMRLIKSFASEAYEEGRFAEKSRRNRDANVSAVKLRSVYEPVVDLINYAGMAAVLLVGASQAMGGEMTIGEIVAFLAFLRLLQSPVRHFSRLLNVYQQSSAAFERIREVLETEPAVAERDGAIALPPMRGRITFDRVSFAYAAGSPVLEKLDLTLEAGRMTALVGSSGAGKSTIAQLIARLYDPQEGEIRIDGTPIRDVTLHSLRAQMGIVSQDVVLFNGTVRENIVYGKPDATDEEVAGAAAAAYAHEFIAELPHGYETQIGERGVKLSGGQKQRLSIARAVLRNPRLVILDEATASLDTESEHKIQAALARLLAGRTSLVIAHRLSTVRMADRILVLDQGRIVESGDHESLLRLGGRYRELYELQFPQRPAERADGALRGG